MGIRAKILTRYIKLIDKFSFSTSSISLFFNPFFLVRKELYDNINELSSHFRSKLLDLGCGTRPYEKLFINVSEYIGLEIDKGIKNNYANFLYDGNKFPFKKGSFEGVFTSQVFEHVFDPENFLSEINRVLKKDGLLLLTVPFIWDEHEQPYDFARYSSFGIQYLLEKSGFEILEHRKTLSNIGVIFQLFNAYVYKIIMKKQTLFRYILLNSITGTWNLLAVVFTHILPSNKDLYMDNIILAKKIINIR